MRTQTSFYGPLEAEPVSGGKANVYRCEVTTEGVGPHYVARLQRVGTQWQVIDPFETILGWVRRNAWQRWEALQAHGDTFVLVACKSTMAEAISAVLEGQRSCG